MNHHCTCNGWKRVFVAFVMGLSLVATTLETTARAQDPVRDDINTAGLDIEALAGWDGVVDRNGPVPISLLVNNYGSEAIEGKLYLSDPNRGSNIEMGELFVGAGATRRFASIQALDDWNECYVSLRQGKKTIWRRPLILNTGQDFYNALNNVIFVDDSGRRLLLPETTPKSGSIGQDEEVAPESGRPLRSLAVKSWQMPNHLGPLTAAEAMVFADDFPVDSLNRAQWKAVARWMCQGGTVFAKQDSKELFDRLLSLAPLHPDPTIDVGPFAVRRIGRGAIYAFANPLFESTTKTDSDTDADSPTQADPGTNNTVRMAIAQVVAKLPKNGLYGITNQIEIRRQRAGRSDWNKITVAIFFLCYTALSGIVAMLLFRFSRRQMGIYIASVVFAACILAAILGVLLRSSRGDLRWTSITTPGAGGVFQLAKIEVHSAGARNRNVVATGSSIDLQATGLARPWYYWNTQPTAHPAYTWQPNLAKGDENRFHSTVSMAPWGSRRLHATAFQKDVPAADFALDFGPSQIPIEKRNESRSRNNWNHDGSSLDLPRARIQLKVKNDLPFDLLQCMLVVGTTIESSGSDETLEQYSSWQREPPAWAKKGTMIDVYHTHLLREDVVSGKTLERGFDAFFQLQENNWNRSGNWDEGTIRAPKLSRLGTTSAWLIARIKKSPIIDIDEPHCDFKRQDELHLYIQQITPENLKNIEVLKASQGQTVPDSEPGSKN